MKEEKEYMEHRKAQRKSVWGPKGTEWRRQGEERSNDTRQ